MRKGLEDALLRVVRSYTLHTPIKKGKYRLYLETVGLCREKHDGRIVTLRDGRRFSLNIPNPLQESVYFLGEYESFLSEVTAKLIAPGGVCFDVGANFGWYTSLMASAVGRTGQVHAFEPVPATFEELHTNYGLWGSPANVHLHQTALGDRIGSVMINVFSGLTTGHASIGEYPGFHSVAVESKMTTLDAYCDERSIKQIDFIKVDIEGAEKVFLTGAASLFDQRHPPIILMEMARLATMNFGYLPNDLIVILRSRADYEFYLADETERRLTRIEGFTESDVGGNVFCIPRSYDRPPGLSRFAGGE